MRIVSLCPSITDSVFALGKGDELVGRTKFCVQPHGLVERIERVGGTKNPKLERIAALRPDIVLMNEEENRKEDAEALRTSGVEVCTTFVRDLEGVASALREIGAAIAADPGPLLAEIDARRRSLRPTTRRSFVYLIWQQPWMAASDDTYVSSLLEAAGGHNVVRGGARYPEVDATRLRAADVVFLSSEPFPFAEKHRASLAEQTGVPIERLALVDGELLSWHGRKTVAGLGYAEALLRAGR